MPTNIEIASSLRQLADTLERNAGGVVVDVEPPPGFVVVRPTGPRGAGKARFWPVAEPNVDHPSEGETIIGYQTKCMHTLDPLTGQALYPYGAWAGNWHTPPGVDWFNFPEIIDRHQHPFDWMTQDELERDALINAQDASSGEKFSPR